MKKLLLIALSTFCAYYSNGQAIQITSQSALYTEDFNSLTNTGTGLSLPSPTNMWLTESGSNANTTYQAGTGSGATGDTYSFGATGKWNFDQ